MLSLNKINVDIGPVGILKNASIDLSQGEMVGLIGRNGAGKTTLLKTIMGILKTKSGEINFENENLVVHPSEKRAQMLIGYMPEDRRLIPSMSSEENIMIPVWAVGLDDWNERLEWIYQIIPEAKDLKDRPSTSLSGGQQKLIALSRALMVGRKLLLLDEPTEGIAPALTKRIIEILNNLKKQGVTTLVAESNEKHYEKMLDRTFTIERGEIKKK
ncbi:MAG: ABC transporter ATP-binding protein [Rhodobacterales bacterium]|jgi:branched-chain amino acid transport system ATP-binding protein|nr:MAG: ABC transporter ATP-binding protein [Rhodobacterales bacterium]|tara:strand:+ start:165 stop:809 length:645 start_codon:yes stop_codon:yes gene_type:complete